MKNKTKILKLVSTTLALTSVSVPVIACTLVPEPIDPPKVWFDIHGDIDNDGRIEAWVGIDLVPRADIINGVPVRNPNSQPNPQAGLFPMGTSSDCVCGIAFMEMEGSPLPSSLNVTGAMVTITNTLTMESNELTQENQNGTQTAIFDFSRSVNLDEQLNQGTLNPGLGQPGKDNTWFAFRDSNVEKVIVPQLQANQIFKLWFEVEVLPVDAPLLAEIPVQFAAGTFADSTHPIDYSDKVHTPEPSSVMGILALGIIGGGATLKRKLKSANSTNK